MSRSFAALLAILIGARLCAVGPVLAGEAARAFASADAAAAALVQALRADDMAALGAILGPGSETLLHSGDRYADAESRRRFLESYDARHALVATGDGRMVLDVGAAEWPLPIPIVRAGEQWRFDSREGALEIVDRRIGRNEVAAIRVALAYVDAQKAFFAGSQEGTGAGVFAQRLVSTPGQHDGLFWPVAEGEAESPFGPLVRQARDEGYPGEIVSGRPIPYQGYNFRILTAQGSTAPGGARGYLRDGRMTEGFALLAWPATWGASGVMTFEVGQDGVVFQKDLGPDTAARARTITRFDPDLSWTRIDIAEH